jgi:uncharacterized protein YciI
MSSMEQFIYTLRATRLEMLSRGPDEQEASVLKEHVAYLQKLVEEGVAILFGRTQTSDETTFGIVVFEAESDSLATQIMERDPCIVSHVMTATLQPFRVAGMREA